MASPIETIVQAYVATVSPQSTDPQEVVDTSPSQSISSSSPDVNNSQQQTTITSSYSYRSFFRRAWDKVESIFVQKDTNLPTYYDNYEREDNEDDDEYDHPNPYQQPFTCSAAFRPPVYKRRLSQHSQELISAGPSDYSPRSSSEWPTRQRYEDWQRDQVDLYVEEANAKDLIAGWAMGEGRPWFD